METKLDSSSGKVVEDSKTVKGILQKRKKRKEMEKTIDVFVWI